MKLATNLPPGASEAVAGAIEHRIE